MPLLKKLNIQSLKNNIMTDLSKLTIIISSYVTSIFTKYKRKIQQVFESWQKITSKIVNLYSMPLSSDLNGVEVKSQLIL